MTEKTEFLITARDATAAAFKSVEQGLGKIGSALFSVQSAVLGAVGVGGMGALVKASMDATDALAKASDRLGITTEALAGLRYAGDLAGVSAEQLDTGLGKMSKTLAEAAGGSKQADEAFRALGLSSRELSQLPADQAFMRISDALMSMDNNMQRLNLTQDIFGRGATGIINLMADGSDGLKAAAAEAKALGLALSRVDAAKIEIANDSMTRIKSVFAGLGNTIAVQVSPYIQALGDWLTKSSVEADGFRSHISTAMEAAVKAVGFLMDMFHGLHVVWKLLQQGWYELQNVVIQGIDSIVNGVRGLADLLPGIEVKPNAALQQWAAESAAGIEQTRAELERLVMDRMPSEGLDEIIAKFKELNATAAQAVAARAEAMAGTGGIETMPGIGDKEAEQTAKYMAELQKQVEALYLSIAPKQEALAIKYAEEQALLDQAYLNNLLSEQLYYEQSALLKSDYETRRTQIEEQGNRQRYMSQFAWQKETAKLMQGSYRDQLAGVGNMLGQLSTLMYSSKKKEFELGKKAAIGQAIINTYLAASNALSMQPFILGVMMAALAVAVGMANVNRIRSQKFGGGGGATPTFNASPGGIPSPESMVPDLPAPTAPSLPQSQTAAPRNVNITIQSESGVFSAAWIRDNLIPGLNEAVGDGVNLRTMAA